MANFYSSVGKQCQAHAIAQNPILFVKEERLCREDNNNKTKNRSSKPLKKRRTWPTNDPCFSLLSAPSSSSTLVYDFYGKLDLLNIVGFFLQLGRTNEIVQRDIIRR